MKAALVSVVIFCLVASAFAQDGEQAPAAAAVPAPVQTQTVVHTDPAVTNSLNELLQTSRGQTESLRNDLKSAVSALGEQAGQSASALKQQQEKLQELAQAVQQQAAAGAELKNSLSTLHESVSSLQQQLREQSKSQTESKAASASSQSDSRLAKIEDNISTIKEFLGVIANAVTKESDRAATLAANVASNHNVTQTLIKDIIQRIQNATANNGGSFTDTFKALYARACDLYRVHVHPYTKDVFGKAAELGSQVADWSKKNGVDFVQNAPKKAQKLQKKALKQYTQTHEQFAQLIVDNGFPKENSQLAAHVALVSGLLLALTLVLVVIRLILSALCGMCCRCSRSKQTAAASPAPAPAPSAQADKSTEQSPKDAAGKNQRPAKPASHRS